MKKKRTVLVNFSGGKDSTVAILEVVKAYPKEEIILCYQDTGAEYLETESHVERIANMFGLPLITLKNPIDFWAMSLGHNKFPTPAFRECTARLKIDLERSWIVKNRIALGSDLIVVMGTRAEESASRAKLQTWAENRATLKDGSFTAWTWYPCLDMKEADIYERIKAEGLPLHPCYEFSKRCSCWCCFFQPNIVVREYAERHPDLYEKACLVEDEIKHKWKDGFGFNDLTKQLRLI